MKFKKGDTILVISGKDKGKKGKIIESFPKKGRIVVEKVNLVKKSVKPKRSGEKGQIVTVPAPLVASKTKLICPKCNKAVRAEYKKEGDRKYRICKKCKQEI